jgi:hypothetical protein
MYMWVHMYSVHVWGSQEVSSLIFKVNGGKWRQKKKHTNMFEHQLFIFQHSPQTCSDTFHGLR